MKTALFADIHSNLEALQACLAHARRQGAERFVCLGDIVGYGADPLACLDLVRELAAPCVLGNHDAAALGGLCESMNDVAREAALWTRRQLGAAERDFLRALPLTLRDGERLCVHASAHQPGDWEYVASDAAARRCVAATDALGVCAGHVHQASFYFGARNAMACFLPQPGVPVPLPRRRRWIVLAGAVGQPRDGNPAAAYVLLDDTRRRATFFRVAYDYTAAARKIVAAGLPEALARRLERGC